METDYTLVLSVITHIMMNEQYVFWAMQPDYFKCWQLVALNVPDTIKVMTSICQPFLHFLILNFKYGHKQIFLIIRILPVLRF